MADATRQSKQRIPVAATQDMCNRKVGMGMCHIQGLWQHGTHRMAGPGEHSKHFDGLHSGDSESEKGVSYGHQKQFNVDRMENRHLQCIGPLAPRPNAHTAVGCITLIKLKLGNQI